MLTEMDGVERLDDVLVVAATNRPDLIDKVSRLEVRGGGGGMWLVLWPRYYILLECVGVFSMGCVAM